MHGQEGFCGSRMRQFRKRRDGIAVTEVLQEVKEAFVTPQNMIAVLIKAVKAGATMGELHDAMREAIGFKFEY